MHFLVVLGDEWHSAEVPKAGLDGLAQHGFEFHWLENVDELSAQQLDAYPLVILAKANYFSGVGEGPWATEQMQQAFVDHVRRGGGLLVLHSGAAGYENAVRLRQLMGGAFREHPDQCPVLIEPSTSHLLTRGCDSFEMHDEQYVMELDDPRAEIFLLTKSEHGEQPAGWVRREGEGRVCVLTPGHNRDVWLHPSYQKLLLNALRWCSNGNVSHG